MPDNWYRRTTWTPKDREEFFARLKRSRGAFNKAQYVRIQALSLLATGKQHAFTDALELLDMLLAEWPDQSSEIAMAHNARAECLLGLGNVPRALDAFRSVFKAQRALPSVRTNAHLTFGWLVATTPLPDCYTEALEVLREFAEVMSFPVNEYRDAAIRALIHDALGHKKDACDYAKMALQHAAATHSGYRYHAKLGLVDSPDATVHKKLQSIAAVRNS